MAQGDDNWGCVIAGIAALGGGWWLYNHYEIREKEPEMEVSAAPQPVYRPTGLIEVTSLGNGTVWRLDANSVTGPRDARQVWIIADHSKNTSVPNRETKTLYRIDCNTTEYRALSIVDYDKDGKVTRDWGTKELGDEHSFPPPGTHIAAVVAEGCRNAFDQPSPLTIPIPSLPSPRDGT